MIKLVDIEAKLVNRRRDGTAICIDAGHEEWNKYLQRDYPKLFWIPVKFIEESDPPLPDLDIGDAVTLEIHEWLALEKGLI